MTSSVDGVLDVEEGAVQYFDEKKKDEDDRFALRRHRRQRGRVRGCTLRTSTRT